MNMNTCKVCNTELPMPAKRGRNVYVSCPNCGAAHRAKFTDVIDGTVAISFTLRRDHNPTRVISFRLPVAAADAVERNKEKFKKIILDNV